MTWRGRHIYLLGLPGAGKSSIGRELAHLLAKSGYEFLDLDEIITKRSGKTIAQIFAEQNGSARFRDLETNLLLEVAQRAFEQKPRIIASGGGTPIRAINRALMRGSGVTVWIDVTIKNAAKNVLQSLLQGETRPLLRSSSPEELNDKLRSLHAERTPFYEQATLHFVTRSPRGDEREPRELAEEMLKALEQMSKRVLLRPRFEIFPVHSTLGDYPVSIGSGIAAQELAFTMRDLGAKKVIIVTDENVAKLYGTKFIQKALGEQRAGVDIHQITISSGEASKNMDNLLDILASFEKLGLKKKEDIVVAFGGGVVSDITGLAASLYMRGMPLVHIPTTLIGQVDASIGGKTGIDHHAKKNIIGTFYAPRQVIIDPLFLKTLPKRELQAGLSEVLKYGLIASESLWKTLAKGIRRLLRGFDTGFEIIIRDAIRQKIGFVEQDELERQNGVRELLNFGHTFAHGFEAATNFETLLHGEAVALGMRAATWLSMELGYLSGEEWREIEQVLGRLPIPASLEVGTDAVMKAMTGDKKQKGAGYRLVVLKNIGRAEIVSEVPEQKVREAIDFVLSVI